MFDLNPFRLEHASLLHFLMVQGTVVLAYLLFRDRFRRQLNRLDEQLRTLRDEREEPILEPEVEEVVVVWPRPDDLKQIAGINPKAEAILNSVGIYRFAQLAQTPVATLRRMLAERGPRLYTYDPVTWPSQARLAAEGRWLELWTWQEQMSRGEFRDFSHLLT